MIKHLARAFIGICLLPVLAVYWLEDSGARVLRQMRNARAKKATRKLYDAALKR
jgi:hypothetical protein